MSNMMDMKQAKQAVMELAKGKYHSISYEVTDHGDGRAVQECGVYVQGFGHFKARFWESCLTDLRTNMQHGEDKPGITEDLPISAATAE